MHLVHLTASTFFGGPERQMLGLGQALPGDLRSSYWSFSEGERCAAFLGRVANAGFDAIALNNDTPRLRAAIRELTARLRVAGANLLLTHGYKANMLGRIAARRCGIPVVAVSRGWTGENLKVRCYEALDRMHLRFMDAVICVSEGQARKVRRTGVAARNIHIIRNSARLDAFRNPDPSYREKLKQLAGGHDNHCVIVAAGRLSPEKGFHVLINAAAQVIARNPIARFVLFGEGQQRALLEKQIQSLGIQGSFVLAGFRDDLDRWLPWADLVVLPSFTEGLPNVALEASAAGVPVVATAVGGTSEVICDGLNGRLVEPGNAAVLASAIAEMLENDSLRRQFGDAGRRFMEERFSFAAQADAYLRLFERLLPNGKSVLKGAA